MDLRKTNSVILHISTFPPRECGIATFTMDLVTAFNKRFNPAVKAAVLALNENLSSHYHYPGIVLDSLDASEIKNYVALAERVNRNTKIKAVNIQHEFGIFGGDWGDYLIPFMQTVKKPVVVTFHSVLSSPDNRLKNIVDFLGQQAKTLVVMNERSKDVLQQDYNIPRSKITIIPHGIPSTTFEPSREPKLELGLKDKIVISTFGMISSDKGIEYVLRALPEVAKTIPNIIYLIIGATHPIVRGHEGESYRNFLNQEVDRLGLKNQVRFYNKYVTVDEIVKYLKASDIYVSAVVNPKQSVSGTLSYALGCGRAVISTPTEYAKHIIKNGENGMFVKFRNSHSIARALKNVLGDEKKLLAMHKNAFEWTRHMIWPNVASSYARIYQKYPGVNTEENKLPRIRLDHLIRLTDNFGIIHHARYSRPQKRFGYSLDDNARAALVCSLYYKISRDERMINLIKIYLKFIKFTQRADGSFTNIVHAGNKKDKTRDQDVQGRAIWALGYIASNQALPDDIRENARSIFLNCLRKKPRLLSPRASAFAMTGLYHYLKVFPNKQLESYFKKLADYKVSLYRKNSTADWRWFEHHLTYSNSKLPESLFYAYDLTKNKEYLKIAEESLRFLKKVTFEPEHYSPIGQNGWYFRYQKRSYFDQQPEDASSMVQTKIAAYKITKHHEHLEDGFRAFQWFLGKNHLNQTVCDEVTGGCYDGLDKYAMNLNQGAESTVAYLLARLAFEDPEIKPYQS